MGFIGHFVFKTFAVEMEMGSVDPDAWLVRALWRILMTWAI